MKTLLSGVLVAASMFASQSGKPSLSFETASVKRHITPIDPTSPKLVTLPRGCHGTDETDPVAPVATTVPLGQCSFLGASVNILIGYAYPKTDIKLPGFPDWVRNDRYDVEGRASRLVTGAELREMLQSLLAERFQLKVHNDGDLIIVDRIQQPFLE